MLRLAIRLVNDKSRVFIESIIRMGVSIVCFIDWDDRKWGEEDDYFRIPICSPYRALEMYTKGEIDRILILPYSGVEIGNNVLGEMVKMGVPSDFFLMPCIPDIASNRIQDIDDLMGCTVNNNKTLYRLQFHIADNCNMNCVGCSHFSSLVKGDEFISISEIKKDLTSLKRLVKHIDRIDILGGEPLLNKKWREYIEVVREIYEYTDITIITNGTLFNTISESEWDYLKKEDVCIRVSIYRPLWSKADGIVDFLKKKGVRYQSNVGTGAIAEFATVFRKTPYADRDRSRKECHAECNQIWHGKMAPCNQMIYIDYFNKHFGMSFPDEVPIEDIEKVKDFDELSRLLNKPMELCRYCNTLRNSYPQTQMWERISNCEDSNNSMDKWIC